MPRLEVPDWLKKKIHVRFSNVCAACGERGELAADVAHLFEDATTEPPREETLIILCSRCNQAEARSHASSKPPFSEFISSEAVEALARKQLRQANYSSAYEAYRLAAYLLAEQGSYSAAVENLVGAVSALRPIRWGDFLGATLRVIERVCLCYKIGPVQRWLCLERVALVLYDYRRWQESADIQGAAQRLRAQIRGDPRYPEDLNMDLASSFRRDAFIKGCTGFVTAPALKLSRLLGRLVEDSQEFERRGYFDAYATNLDVASKLASEAGEDVEAAHVYSQLALEKVKKITHKWVLQEHYWREARYYHLKHDRTKTLDSVVEALRLFNEHKVVLEPMLGGTGPVRHDPFENLKRFSISVDELREHDAAPSGNAPPELPLNIDKNELEQIVNNIKG